MHNPKPTALPKLMKFVNLLTDHQNISNLLLLKYMFSKHSNILKWTNFRQSFLDFNIDFEEDENIFCDRDEFYSESESNESSWKNKSEKI